MKNVLLACLLLLAIPALASAEDPFNFDGDLPTTTAEVEAGSVGGGSTFASLERRIAALEAKAISAAECREIANEVVDKRINELRLAIDTPGGGQRIQTVNFKTVGDVSSFQLAPGERLSSYTDGAGNVVRCDRPTCNCGCDNLRCSPPPAASHAVQQTIAPTVYAPPVAYAQPVTYSQPTTWATQDVAFTVNSVSDSPAVQTVSMQPVRRGLFGLRRGWEPTSTVNASSASSSPSGTTTCRRVLVGGKWVKVCN